MSTKGIADVVFCLDASGSMQPCIDGVRAHIFDFLDGIKSNTQLTWDLRLDFVAYAAQGASVFARFDGHDQQDHDQPQVSHRSVFHDEVLGPLYHGEQGRFFTSDTGELQDALEKVPADGDEATLIALDFALDYPWRDASACHRAVILLTDEPFEGGAYQSIQKAKVKQLIKKIQQLRVMLFLIAPESPVYNELATVDRSEYEVVEGGDGLAGVDFGAALSYIGKSLSVSQLQGGTEGSARRGLFGQPGWR
jgi:hypothetical protein